MRPFLITPELKQQIVRVMTYAAEPAHHFRPFRGDGPPGDKPEHTIYQSFGFKIVFSITDSEGGPEPRKLYRHLSISVSGKDRLPNPFIVEEVAHLFGFVGSLSDRNWQIAHDGDAIAVAQEIGG